MRILLRAVALFLLIFESMAQNPKIGLVGQACLSYYTVRSESSVAAQDFRQQNKPIFALQTGLLFFKPLSDNVEAVMGLLYTERGFKSQFNTNTIYAFSFAPGYTLKISDRYLEIPLLANIYLKKSQLSWFITVGVKPAVYISTRVKALGVEGGTSNFNYHAHRRVNLFVVFGAGADISIGARGHLLLWPTLDHSVLTDVTGQALSLFPYSLGVNVCFGYSLGN